MTPFAFILIALASWRLAMLASVDTITQGFRDRVANRWKPHLIPLRDGNGDEVNGTGTLRASWPVRLLNCPSCCDLWTSGAGMLVAHAAGFADGWRWVWLGWLGAAGVGVLLSDLSERLSR